MKSQDTYPFPVDIKDSEGASKGVFSKIKEFESNPDYIVKELDVVNDSLRLQKVLNHETDEYEDHPMTFERFKKEVGETEKILTSSKTKINSFIPKRMLVYGTGESGKERGFIVMERVKGVNIFDAETLSKEDVNELEKLVLTSLDFYFDEQVSSNRKLIPDLVTGNYNDPQLSNIMIGRTKSNSKKKVWFVDTYPLRRPMMTIDPYFDQLKRALEKLSQKKEIQYSEKLVRRLNSFGDTEFKP